MKARLSQGPLRMAGDNGLGQEFISNVKLDMEECFINDGGFNESV